MSDNTSVAQRHAGNISGVVFSARDDVYYKSHGLHEITKPLDLSANPNDVDKLNTLSSKMLGPVITNKANCRVCARTPLTCPGHFGIISNLMLMAVPGREDAIFEMVKRICVVCSSFSVSDKCGNCGSDLPSVRRGQPGQFIISVSDNKSIDLSSWEEIRNYIYKLKPGDIDSLIRLIYPNAAPGCGINNLFTSVVLVPPNSMRPETPVKGQNKMAQSVDTKNLNSIITEFANEGRNRFINNKNSKMLKVVYEYYSLDMQPVTVTLGTFDLQSDDSKNSFVQMLTKFGFIRKFTIGKITFGIGRMVNTSSNMLPMTVIGLNNDASQSYVIKVTVNHNNIKSILRKLNKPSARRFVTIVKKDGRIIKGTSTFKFDYVPTYGDKIFLPINKEILIVNRQPTKGRRSVFAMIAERLSFATGAYLNSNIADLLDGDYDGDELSVSKLHERLTQLSVYITMSVANLLFSDSSPGVVHGLIDEAIIGIAKMSITKMKLTKAQFFGLFIKCSYPFYIKEKEYYTGSDVITAILYDTGLNYERKIYKEDSFEWKAFGPDHAEVVIKNGVHIKGLINDEVVGKSFKSIFTKMAFMIEPIRVLEKVAMFYWVGIEASAMMGNSFSFSDLASNDRNYNLMKAGKRLTMDKLRSVVEIYQCNTSVSNDNIIQLAEAVSIPNPELLKLYNRTLATSPEMEYQCNDLQYSNVCGLGPNTKQINAFVGSGYFSIINGKFASETMLYGRMLSNERIGEHKIVPLGYTEGNLIIGHQFEDKLKQASLAASAFSMKVIYVSVPGRIFNNTKFGYDAMVISPLDEVIYNGINIARFNGRCNLIPGRCKYFNIKEIFDIELSIDDFLGDSGLFNLYTELRATAEKRLDLGKNFDIFGINATELVFWDKETNLKLATEGNLKLIRPNGGFIDLRNKIQSSRAELLEIYRACIKRFYTLTGTSGFIWRQHIAMIVYYFLTTTPLSTPEFADKRVLALYMKSIEQVYYEKVLQAGSSLGDHMTEACLSNFIQERLDAHKKPEKKRNDNELKSVLGPDLNEDEVEMIIFMKDGTDLETTKKVARDLIEIKLKDILPLNGVEVKRDATDIEYAIRAYKSSMRRSFKITTNFRLTFDKKAMYTEGITPFMLYKAMLRDLPFECIPVVISENLVQFCITIPDINLIQSQLETIGNVRVGGVSGILNAQAMSQNNINYIMTLGSNISKILERPHINKDRLLVNDVRLMHKYFGITGSIISQTLTSMLKIRGVHVSYLHMLSVGRHSTGTALTVNRTGATKTPNAILKEIAGGNPYQNTPNAAIENRVDSTVLHSSIKSTLLGQPPKIASNYPTTRIDLKKLRDFVTQYNKKVTTEEIMSRFKE